MLAKLKTALRSRSTSTTVATIVGAGSVTAGVAGYDWRASLIVGGALLAVLSEAMGR